MTHTLDPAMWAETADLCSRTGADHFTVGAADTGYWAQAEAAGTLVRVEGQASPNAACLRLAVALLDPPEGRAATSDDVGKMGGGTRRGDGGNLE